MRIVYPKFKNGEATVREVKVNQNFGMSKPKLCLDFNIFFHFNWTVNSTLSHYFTYLAYVEGIYQTYIKSCCNNTRQVASIKLQQLTTGPMETMLIKEPREKAIREKKDKKNVVFDDRMWSTTGCLEKSTIHDRHNGECWWFSSVFRNYTVRGDQQEKLLISSSTWDFPVYLWLHFLNTNAYVNL